MTDKNRLKEALRRWENHTLADSIQKRPEARNQFRTYTGIPVKRFYTPLDAAQIDYLRDLGFPGEYPFTRGIYPTMYRGQPWTIRQYAGFGTAKDTNERFKYLLGLGETGLSVAFDLPTQIGYDSDNPRAEGEIGRVGVAVNSLRDMEQIFDGIPLDRVSTSFTINSIAAIILAMYAVVAEEQGVPMNKIAGTIQNDPLKEIASRGTWVLPPEPSIKLVMDTLEYCSESMPRFNPISIAGAHYRDAGASAIQEVAFTFADGITYVKAAVKRGLDADEFAGRLSFYFYTHIDFFEEIAKYRAARRLWAKIMLEKFGAKKRSSSMFRFGCVCGGSTLTAQEPENNLIRVTIEALSSVLGGVQAMFTAAMDESISLPTEKAARLAVRTQQIIAEEIGVTNTIDPMAGSYFVESLTNYIEQEAQQLIDKIESMGGMVQAIRNGFIQRTIAQRALEFQREVDRGERIVVGVNKYNLGEKQDIKIFQVDPAVEKQVLTDLAELKSRRDNAIVKRSLEDLREVAVSNRNVMPNIIHAVKAYATVQEIMDVFRDIYGEWKEVSIF